VCLSALAVHLHVGRDVTDVVAPQLNQPADAVQQWGRFLTVQAVAMVQADHARRAAIQLQGEPQTAAQAPLAFPTPQTQP
jgi:hypothetical protein